MKLQCPICKKPLETIGHTAVCENRHSFDYAREGYLFLLRSGAKAHGDNAEMVRARTAFLSRSYYRFLRDAIARLLEEEDVQVLADLGCGEGYYTSACPGSEKYGFDLSRDAIKHAAKQDKTTQYAVAGIFDLPLPEACCDAVLTCFAPAAAAEVERVLKPGGRFVYVFPGRDHLYELKQVLYETPYRNEEKGPLLSLPEEKEIRVKEAIALDHESLMNLFQMTPYAYRTGRRGIEKLKDIASISVTAEFLIRVYRKPQ